MQKLQPPSHITYHNVEQGSEEWHLLRNNNNFTGSNAYKLLTSFGGGSWAMAQDSSFKGTFSTKRGHTLESEAIELYNAIKGVEVEHTGLVTNDLYPNCLYSPDGFLPLKTIEVKCFGPEQHLKTIKSPSLEMKAQVHFGQLIMEKPSSDLVLYCPKPKRWNDEIDGEWPVPVDKMLVIIEIEAHQKILDNFKRIIQEYNTRYG